MIANLYFYVADSSRKSKKKARPPVSLTASYTSTKAEELISLIRTLHSLEAWNPYINDVISAHLKCVHNLVCSNEQAPASQVNDIYDHHLITESQLISRPLASVLCM